MNKVSLILLPVMLPLATLVTACTYDPKAYEEQRQKDNAEHDKQGY